MLEWTATLFTESLELISVIVKAVCCSPITFITIRFSPETLLGADSFLNFPLFTSSKPSANYITEFFRLTEDLSDSSRIRAFLPGIRN